MTNRHWYDDSNGERERERERERGGREWGGRRRVFQGIKLSFLSCFFTGTITAISGQVPRFCFFFFFPKSGEWCHKLCSSGTHSVLNHGQQSIHKHSLPAASGTSHKGLRVCARMTQLPGLRGTTQEKQLHFTRRGTLVFSVFALAARSTGKTEHFSWPLFVLPHWDTMRKTV